MPSTKLAKATTERPTKKAKHGKRVHLKPKLSSPSASASENKTRSVYLDDNKSDIDSPLKTLRVASHSVTSGKEQESSLPSSFKVIAGSYERILYGLQGNVSIASSASSQLEWTLKPIFVFPAHVSCIKSVAASPNGGKWLATGSGDEIIKVWDLRRRKEIGGLMQHEGSITHLTFPSRSHLISASEDGTLCLFRARDWAVLRSLKGHKGRVNSVAVHPSGKVALSVGKDRTLYMWDLMRGRSAASTKLGFEGELVRWSTTGSFLVVQHQKTINVYSKELATLYTVEHTSRIHDVKFAKKVDGSEIVLVAAEDKKTTVYEVIVDTGTLLRPTAHLIGHGNRVKALDTIRIAHPSDSRRSMTVLCTVSSDGTFNVYDLSLLPSPTLTETGDPPEIIPVVTYDSKGSRLTCVTLADGDMDRLEQRVDDKIVNRKRGRELESEDEDEEWIGLSPRVLQRAV